MSLLAQLSETVAHTLFPMNASCIGCKMDHELDAHHLCESCREELVPLNSRVCQKCGHGLDLHRSGSLCRGCVTADYAFERVISCFEYTDILKHMIHHMKYGDQTFYARYFATYLVERYYASDLPIVAVLSVPTHCEKKWEKGYHAAELLTRFFCEETGLPNLSQVVVKMRATPPQATLSGSERRLNLRGAFDCEQDLSDYAAVLVIDDLFTTGSTMNEVAKELKKAGVSEVYGLTLATGRRE